MEDKKTQGGVSVVTLLQIIFAVCYYADPCRKDDQKDCSTLIAEWKPWQVWLPMIISASILGVALLLGGLGCCFRVCCQPSPSTSTFAYAPPAPHSLTYQPKENDNLV